MEGQEIQTSASKGWFLESHTRCAVRARPSHPGNAGYQARRHGHDRRTQTRALSRFYEPHLSLGRQERGRTGASGDARSACTLYNLDELRRFGWASPSADTHQSCADAMLKLIWWCAPRGKCICMATPRVFMFFMKNLKQTRVSWPSHQTAKFAQKVRCKVSQEYRTSLRSKVARVGTDAESFEIQVLGC